MPPVHPLWSPLWAVSMGVIVRENVSMYMVVPAGEGSQGMAAGAEQCVGPLPQLQTPAGVAVVSHRNDKLGRF